MRAFGHEIFVRHAGASKGGVLCLHSSGQNHRQWRGYVQTFESLGMPLHTLDFLGCGKSEPWRGAAPFHFSADVAVAVELVRALEATMIVGHSYGGAVAFHAARLLGDELRRLAVFDPVLWGLHYELKGEARMSHMVERGFFDEAARGTSEWLKAFVDYWQGDGAWERLPEPGRKQMEADAAQTFDQVRSIAFDWTPQRSYAAIRSKTLVVSGAQTPPEMVAIGKRAAAGSGGEHTTVVGGHLTPLLDRMRFESAIVDFFG
ncbi:MAG: alpha/beta hydrolase [Myxococcota bacterium]